ncbi:MAG: alpha-E domain-containing protein [Chloroflexota bacterium]
MLSRVADSVYWLSRYIERAENIARFIDVNLHLMLDTPMETRLQWDPLVTVTGDSDLFAQRYGDVTRDTVIQFLTFDADYPNSIVSCLRKAREQARCVREVISSEMWRSINEFFLFVTSPEARGNAFSDPHTFFNQVRLGSHRFTGVRASTMSHGEAWHFSQLGELIERADKTSRILDVKYFILLPKVEYVGTPYDNIQWAAVLKSASALEMYRKRFQQISSRNVANFLIFDREFPRSISNCVERAEQSLHRITGSPTGTFANPAEQQLGRLSAELNYSDIEEVLSSGFHKYLDNLQLRLNMVHKAIFDTFFTLAPRNATAGIAPTPTE